MERHTVLRIAAASLCLHVFCFTTSAQQPASSSYPGASFWEPTNGPTGASVQGLARGASGTVIAVTLNGTYRSANSGDSWMQGGPLGSSAAAGPGAAFYAGSNGQGVYRSTDDGLSWTKLTGMSPYVRSLLALPNGSVFAGTAVNSPGVANKGAVYYSKENGDSWSQVFPRGGVTIDYAVQCVAIDSSGHLLFSTERGAVFHSLDTGKTYTMPSGVEATTALEVATDGTVFAASRSGAFRSTDHGLAWTRIIAGLTDTVVTALTLRGENEVLAGTPSGIFRSTNKGTSWSALSSAAKNAVEFQWLEYPALLAGTASGILQSSDAGSTWRSGNTGMSTDYVYALAVDPQAKVFASSASGIFSTADRGHTWSHATMGTGWRGPVWFAFKDQLVGFAVCADSGVFRTTDGGDTWSAASAGLANTSPRTIIVSNGGAAILGTWGDGIFRSSNSGNTWTHIATGVDTIVTACARTSAGRLLMGAVGTVLQSTDEGLSWVRLGSGLPVRSVRAVCPGDAHTIFAAMTDSGIFKSTDDGASWLASNTGLPPSGAHVYALACNRQGQLFAGGYEGVFRSTNAGDSWEAIGDGLPIQLTVSLVMDSSGYLYAGTGGAGVWRSRASTLVSVPFGQEQPIRAELYGNYPNPFNATTSIRYGVGVVSREGLVAARVRLAVYDLLGREVAVLVDEQKQPGEYTAIWDAREMASGVYICRLIAGKHAVSTKMLLTK